MTNEELEKHYMTCVDRDCTKIDCVLAREMSDKITDLHNGLKKAELDPKYNNLLTDL